MLLTATPVIAGIALIAAIVIAFRKADKLPTPRTEPQPIRRVGAGRGLSADEFDDFPTIGGANQARMRQPTRTGTVYEPSVATATPEVPYVPDMSNVILMPQADSEPVTAPHHTPAADPCTPTHDSGSSDSSHHSSSDHCHSSSDSGGGFDGGGHGGHH